MLPFLLLLVAIDAGVDSQGVKLSVVHKKFAENARPYRKGCVPEEQWSLVKGGGPAVPFVTVCKTGLPTDTEVRVGKNSVTVIRNGGAQAGFYFSEKFQLSPWLPLEQTACTFIGSGEYTHSITDWRTLMTKVWKGDSSKTFEICGTHGADDHLIVPLVKVDAAALENQKARLGSCALTMDATGKNGRISWGKPDPNDPVQVKLLFASESVLIAQITDPAHMKSPAKSWIHADHLEIFAGGVQYGIPIEPGPVEVGFGKASGLPLVRRWTANGSYLMRIDLPKRGQFDYEFAAVYSQGLNGTAQKRLIGTSFTRGANAKLGSYSMTLNEDYAGRHVTCEIRNGSLEVGPPVEKEVVFMPQN